MDQYQVVITVTRYNEKEIREACEISAEEMMELDYEAHKRAHRDAVVFRNQVYADDYLGVALTELIAQNERVKDAREEMHKAVVGSDTPISVASERLHAENCKLKKMVRGLLADPVMVEI